MKRPGWRWRSLQQEQRHRGRLWSGILSLRGWVGYRFALGQISDVALIALRYNCKRAILDEQQAKSGLTGSASTQMGANLGFVARFGPFCVASSVLENVRTPKSGILYTQLFSTYSLSAIR